MSIPYHRQASIFVKYLESKNRRFAEVGRNMLYYNYQRYHESLDNVTPADVYTGRAVRILKERDRIKERTMKQRKREYKKAIAIRQTMS